MRPYSTPNAVLGRELAHAAFVLVRTLPHVRLKLLAVFEFLPNQKMSPYPFTTELYPLEKCPGKNRREWVKTEHRNEKDDESDNKLLLESNRFNEDMFHLLWKHCSTWNARAQRHEGDGCDGV